MDLNRHRYTIPLGALSGLLLVLSLPKPDLYPLAWFALIPLMFVLARSSSTRSVSAAAYAAGLAFFVGVFYWMTETMIIYGGLDAASAFGVGLLFSLVFALYFLAFGLCLYAF